MKILILNQAFFPDSVSTSQYVTDIARDLDARGHEITVVCDRRDYTQRRRLYPRFSTDGRIRIYRVSSTGFGKSSKAFRILDAVSYDLATIWRLARLPRQDVVLAFTSPPFAGVFGALAARWWRARLIHWIMNINHEIAIELGYVRKDSLIAKALTHAYRYTLRQSARVIVMDRWMKAHVARENIVAPQDIEVIPLWPIHEASADDDIGAKRFREQYGLSDKFVVLHSGNLSFIHPLDTVLKAAMRLKDDPAIVFVFIGQGIREHDIDEVVTKEHLTNILKLPYQPREKLGHSLGIADLHLIIMGNAASGLAHSSKIYSILESGQPYVFVGPHDSHIISDVLEACPGGSHVENGDVDGLLAAIETLRQMSPAKLERIQQMNRAFVARRFDRSQSLVQFAQLLDGVRANDDPE